MSAANNHSAKNPWRCTFCNPPKKAAVYRVLVPGNDLYFNYWDGKRWHGGMNDVADALRWANNPLEDEVLKWRLIP